MSSVNIVDFQKVEILPSNQPALGVYSFRKGNPVISFTLPATARYLKTNTLRINGSLKITGDAGLPNNNTGKNGVAAQSIKLSSRVGVHSCFQNVNLVSAASNQSLESIRQYGRLVASLLSSTHSQQDMITEKSCVAVMNGLDSSSGLLVNNQISFSVPLYAGMLQGQSLVPMSQNGVNGLTINIELASDQQVLSGTNANDGEGAFYELSDMSLTADLAVPDAEGVQMLSQAGSGQLEYNTWSSLYSVINSSDATQTYNLANSRVLSIVHNFLPVSFSNSYNHDGFTTGELKNVAGGDYTGSVELRRVSFSRNGVPFGVDYEFKCSDQSASKIPETQVMMKYLQAYQPLGRMLNSRRLLDFGGQPLRLDRPDGKANNRDKGVRGDARRNFGIGLETDPVSDVGVDFKGQSYATRIVSTLDGQSPNAVFTHLLCKNVLTFSPSGIMVSN